MTADGSADDLALERALYLRGAESSGRQVAALLLQLVGDVEHLAELRARALAGSPPLDGVASDAIDAQRMTDAEQAAASKAIERFDELDDATTLWALEELIREAIYQEQLFEYLYEASPALHTQILERRHTMLRRIQAASRS